MIRYLNRIKLNRSNFLVVILMLLNLGLLGYLFYFKSLINNRSNANSGCLHGTAAEENLKIKLLEEKCLIDRNVRFFSDDSNSLTVAEIAGDGRFFFFLPSTGCHNCFGGFLFDIERYCGKEFLSQIIFYTSFVDSSSLKQIKEDFEIEIFTIKDNYLGFLSERTQIHFMFYLDEKLNVKYLYKPEESLKELNQWYFRFCKNISEI